MLPAPVSTGAGRGGEGASSLTSGRCVRVHAGQDGHQHGQHTAHSHRHCSALAQLGLSRRLTNPWRSAVSYPTVPLPAARH